MHTHLSYYIMSICSQSCRTKNLIWTPSESRIQAQKAKYLALKSLRSLILAKSLTPPEYSQIVRFRSRSTNLDNSKLRASKHTDAQKQVPGQRFFNSAKQANSKGQAGERSPSIVPETKLRTVRVEEDVAKRCDEVVKAGRGVA